MTLPYLLDINICIYTRDNRPPAVAARLREISSGDLAMSVITYGELSWGAQRSKNPDGRDKLQRLIALVPVLALPVGAGQIYGRLRASLETRGRIIGPNDLWIASHAIASDLTLVTNNEREFRRVEGLKIENWAK